MDSVAQIADEVNTPLDTDEYAALGDLLGGLDSLTEHENAGQSYLLAKGPARLVAVLDVSGNPLLSGAGQC